MQYLNDFHNSVTYELSSNQVVMYRTVYNFMNWLTDIGGLYGAIYGICLAVVSISQFQGANMLLMTELFGKPSTAPMNRNSLKRGSNALKAMQKS